MLNVILSLAALILLVLGGIVLYSNSRAESNRWLSFFLGAGFLWVLANLLANNANTEAGNLFFSRFALVGASLAPLAFLMFCGSFTQNKVFDSLRNRLIAYLPVGILLLSTPTSLNVVKASRKTFEPGIAYGLLLMVFVIYFSYSIAMLIHEYKRSKKERRDQLNYILRGAALTIIPAVILSVVLPVLGYPDAAPAAPALVIIMSAFTTVAIVKHRLFNIRSFVFRSMAYTLSTLVLGTIFIAPIIFMIIKITDITFVLHEFIISVLAITIAATNYYKLRVWFDNLTKWIFFRDTYDSAALLGQMNRLLVSTIDLRNMLLESGGMIVSNLKADFCYFTLMDKNQPEQRIIGSGDKGLPHDIVHMAQKIMTSGGTKVIITDYIDPEYRKFKDALAGNDIAAIVQLSPSGNKDEIIGYMFLGFKKSGNPYDAQDVHTLETIADVLFIAIQNALHFEEIQKFNITLQEKVNEATLQLRRTNAKLKALDETKDDFISMASHQLRTPLTSVKGYLSMVLEGDAGKLTPLQRKMLDQAFVSSQRMVFLIADLLNVSRLKTGKFIIEPSKVDLSKTILDEVSQLKETAKNRNLELIYDRPADFPVLMIDETKIRQVIMNFIDNAIYYTPAGGKIHIELIDTPVSVQFKVKDNGIGVPKREQPHLFTKFYRAGNARQARPDGTGLGLFMAKKVVVAQGGAVIFDSSEGQGSTFGFIFPKQKLALTEKPKALQVT